MEITADNLKEIKIDNLVKLWNIFAREEWGSRIYPMWELDEVLYGIKPSKLLDMIDDFNVRDDCFYYDNNELLASGYYDNAVDAVIDFEALAKDLGQNPERYKDEIECDEYAEILLHSTGLDEVEWEDLMVSYTPMEIETARNAKITKAEAQALKELKGSCSLLDCHTFDEDIDYLLTYCSVEE